MGTLLITVAVVSYVVFLIVGLCLYEGASLPGLAVMGFAFFAIPSTFICTAAAFTAYSAVKYFPLWYGVLVAVMCVVVGIGLGYAAVRGIVKSITREP